MIILQEGNSSSNWVHARIILIIPPLICQCFIKLMKDYIAILKWPRGFPGDSVVKNLPANAGDMGSILGQEDPLEKEMATHSSTLAWKIPWTEEPDRLQSMVSQRVRNDWATSLSFFLWYDFPLVIYSTDSGATTAESGSGTRWVLLTIPDLAGDVRLSPVLLESN